MFAESKDEVALILFGCNDTDNPLNEADEDSYQNIVLKRSLGIADFDLLQLVQSELEPGGHPGDCILDLWTWYYTNVFTANYVWKFWSSRVQA